MSDWIRQRELFTALVVGDATALAEESVALTEGRVRTKIAWRDAGAALGPQPDRPILLVEAQGVDDATLAEELPSIASAIVLLELNAVVALDDAQIDLVAGVLLGPSVQLLCAPTMVQRIAAVVEAVELSKRLALHDRVSEGEAARLAKLNEEVARIAEVLARLSRREDVAMLAGPAVADRRPSYDAGVDRSDPVDPSLVRGMIRARRLRDRQFGAGLFEDPAWDMLLDLFAAHLERAQVSVSSLCIASAVAPTTALRWIGKLTDAGLVERQPDPFDRRRAFMALSKTALEAMRGYFTTLRHQGLPVT